MVMSTSAKVTWLGHSTFKIITPGGKTLLLDPWVENNPACPAEHKRIETLDGMLITHGHFDHIGDAVAIAKATTPAKVVAVYETTVWLESKGVHNCSGMNKGGTQEVVPGVRVTMVHADHSCGILDEGRIIYGGDPCGYVIELEDGFKIYHAGDTNVFGDMRLIGEIYRPDLAMLPVGDLYTMSAREAAVAVRLLGTKRIVPMHHGTFPSLTGTPKELRQLTREIPEVEIVELEPGQSLG